MRIIYSVRDSVCCVQAAPLGPEGAQGHDGPLWPWAFCMGPLAHPWARPGLLGRTETALRENCAASKLRCEETALRANGSAGARSVEEYNSICPKAPCGTLFLLKIQFYPPKRPLRNAFLAQNTILSAQKAPAGRLSVIP